jgi:hypothetical protein
VQRVPEVTPSSSWRRTEESNAFSRSGKRYPRSRHNGLAHLPGRLAIQEGNS